MKGLLSGTEADGTYDIKGFTKKWKQKKDKPGVVAPAKILVVSENNVLVEVR